MTLNAILTRACLAMGIGLMGSGLSMLGRFIRCQERAASALETIARKMQEQGRA